MILAELNGLMCVCRSNDISLIWMNK